MRHFNLLLVRHVTRQSHAKVANYRHYETWYDLTEVRLLELKNVENMLLSNKKAPMTGGGQGACEGWKIWLSRTLFNQILMAFDTLRSERCLLNANYTLEQFCDRVIGAPERLNESSPRGQVGVNK